MGRKEGEREGIDGGVGKEEGVGFGMLLLCNCRVDLRRANLGCQIERI